MKPTQEPLNSSAIRNLAAFGVLLAVGIAAYSNSFSGPFVLDDLDEITLNNHVRVRQLDARSLWDAAWRSPSDRRPVANVTLALNYYFGQYDVWGYHAANFAIHLACGMLVYLFAKKTLTRVQSNEPAASISLVALAAALIFVCHPVQTQAVTYVCQRMTSLAVLFYLAAFLFYISGRTAAAPWRRWFLWAGAVVSWILSLGTKEIALVFPLAVLTYEWYFFQNLDLKWMRRALVYLVPALALLAVIALSSQTVRDTLIGSYVKRDFTMLQRVMTEWRVLVYYLSLVIWPLPSRLSITHDMLPSQSLFVPITTLLSLLTLLALLGVAVVMAKRYRIISFGLVWFFLHLAIESTIVPLELAFEHRLYLPMVGPSIVASWGLWTALGNFRWFVLSTAVLVLLLATATYERNRVWQDDFVLWSDVLEKYPQDARAHNNLGIALDAKHQPAEAAEAYRRAVALRPEYADAFNNLGGSLTELGRPAEAIEYYRRAIELDSSHADTHYNLGVALSRLGQVDEAMAMFRKAVELRPGFVEAHNNLGDALDNQGRLDEAIEQYRLALAVESERAEVLNNLGVTLAKQGKVDEAIKALEQSLAAQPDDADTHYNLGTLLDSQGQKLGAESHFRRALELAVAKGDQALVDAIQVRLRSQP